MKVVHITPTYFDESSVIGGDVCYPTELSREMAKSVDTTLVSFGSARKSYVNDDLKVEIYPVRRFIHGNKVNPLSFRYLRAIRDGIVHIHHVHTLVSDLRTPGRILFWETLLCHRLWLVVVEPVLNQRLPGVLEALPESNC